MWRLGVVTDPGNVPTGQVPQLTPCVVDGVLVVYPGDEQVCARLKVPAAVTG